MAEATFGDLVKGVVDVSRGLLAVDAGMHSDLEALLLDAGSRQGDLWGISFYPREFGTTGFLEYDSMINLRPGQGNRTRSVDDPVARAGGRRAPDWRTRLLRSVGEPRLPPARC